MELEASTPQCTTNESWKANDDVHGNKKSNHEFEGVECASPKKSKTHFMYGWCRNLQSLVNEVRIQSKLRCILCPRSIKTFGTSNAHETRHLMLNWTRKKRHAKFHLYGQRGTNEFKLGKAIQIKKGVLNFHWKEMGMGSCALLVKKIYMSVVQRRELLFECSSNLHSKRQRSNSSRHSYVHSYALDVGDGSKVGCGLRS